MNGRTWSTAAILALAVAVPAVPVVTATAASAHSSAAVQVAKHGADDPAGHDAGKGNGKRQNENAHRKFNLGGKVTAVDPEAKTVTFTVHGGRFKALRQTDLTVTVADNARVRRNDAAATLADFQVGDKVRAKGVVTDGVWTANRIKAEGPDATDPGDAPGGGSGDPGTGTGSV
jgi:hypothetical protein